MKKNKPEGERTIKEVIERISVENDINEGLEPYGVWKIPEINIEGIKMPEFKPELPEEDKIGMGINPFIIHVEKPQSPIIGMIEQAIGEITIDSIDDVVDLVTEHRHTFDNHLVHNADAIVDTFNCMHFDNYENVYNVLKQIVKIPLHEVDLIEDNDNIWGQTNGNWILIKLRSKIGMIQTLIHEEAHVRLHYPKDYVYIRDMTHNDIELAALYHKEELEANFVEYVLSRILGTNPMNAGDFLKIYSEIQIREKEVKECIKSMYEDITAVFRGNNVEESGIWGITIETSVNRS